MPSMQCVNPVGVAQHVVQRGRDGRPCFFREIDYLRFLQDLCEAALHYECRVHAYALTTDRVHLLVTPDCLGAVPAMMRAVGQQHVRHINDPLHRADILWESRHNSCLVDDESHVLACHRYIELSPVRAGMTASADNYRWSSHAANGFGRHDPLISPHPVYTGLADDLAMRCLRSRALVAQGIHPDERDVIRQHLYGEWVQENRAGFIAEMRSDEFPGGHLQVAD